MTLKKVSSHVPSSIDTFTGASFDYLNPSNINIFDIAIPLSREPRFGGHTMEAYHVATHSLNGARLILAHGIHMDRAGGPTFLGHSIYPFDVIPPENPAYGIGLTLLFAKAFLFHDASEAYMKDLPTPLKKLIPEYIKIEENVTSNIYSTFNLINKHFNVLDHYRVIEYFDKLMFTLEFPKYMGYKKTIDYSKEYDFPSLTDQEKQCLYLDPIDSDRSAILFLKTYHDINNMIREYDSTLPLESRYRIGTEK